MPFVFDACSPLWERPRERFGQNNYEYHDDMMSWTPPTTVPWLCKMMAVKAVKGQLGSIYEDLSVSHH